MGWNGYSDYTPVATKKEKARKQLIKLQKKDPGVTPIVIEGRKIAKTWWGISWCKNLESYADYSNRIGRGGTYIRNGFVLDLRVEQGLIRGKVCGSSLYDVTIKIDPLNEKAKAEIINAVGRRIESIESLTNGAFPEEFQELFLRQGKGLFPTPREIHLDCSCPDWADMCKHVAAVLYGVGARLDTDPLIFFKLRGIDVNEFIKKSLDEKLKNMMRNAGKKTDRVLDNADIGELFGV
ncbi:MAG: SWIM zinc finger family protein [Clostridiales bacterium]|jgi:uncharacterized Zn finger protein|nr:SWIM zinc finger family protein [Clostridiales bacterium]